MPQQLAWFLGILLCVACHAQRDVERPLAPAGIRAPEGLRVRLTARANGFQIYACQRAASDANQLEWKLKAPEAELVDSEGTPVGKHFAGPTWQARDGSKIVGKLRAKVDAPSSTAVPWLLLDVVSSEGSGLLGQVRNVQRLDTVGGVAPAAGCDAAHVGAEARVPYQALYVFFAE